MTPIEKIKTHENAVSRVVERRSINEAGEGNACGADGRCGPISERLGHTSPTAAR